jgi:hypothetical protein
VSADEQIRWGLKYIRRVYGRAAEKGAWYDEGGVLPPGITRVHNATDEPEPVESPDADSDTP